jgi:diguanylate cyclase (GGDEF)-like protein
LLLDTKTLMFVLTFVVLMVALALHITWRLNRSVPGIREWSLGFLNISAGIVLLTAQKVLPLITPVIADLLIINGYYLLWRGVRMFKDEEQLYQPGYLLVIALTGIAITYLTLVADNPGVRILLVTWIIALQLLVLAREFFVDMPYANAATRLTGISCGLHFALHTALGFIILFGPQIRSVFDPLLANQLIFLGGFNTAILLAFGLIIMTTARLQAELKLQASRDPLTGALNRRAFFSTTEPVLARNRREGEALTLLVADLDNFKTINDQHGHAVGDEVLKLFVKVSKSTLRGQDILARFGGEEFVILLPNTNPEQAHEVAERLRTAFSQACKEQEDKPDATVSIGIAERASDDHALDSLIARADSALYLAKQAGRDQVQLAADAR